MIVFAILHALIFVPADLPPKSVEFPGGSKVEFVFISPGKFFMGSSTTEPSRDADEGPQHPVTISRGFYLSVHEVTQRQWLAIMGDNPSVFRRSMAGEDSQDFPVDSVSWNDVQRFIARLNSMGLGRFRLPTEAEWEYAARAGTDTPFSISGDVRTFAWANSWSMARPHPVGRKTPNAWGLFDMHGNVWEWCGDWYAPYDGNSQIDPEGPSSGGEKVFRGGSWYDFPYSLRTANRHKHTPNQKYSSIGFRLVLEPEVFKERTAILPKGVTMRFVTLPPGSFLMGSQQTESGRASDEGPISRINISRSFAIGTYEVTQTQWHAVMDENPSIFSEDWNNPVEMVSWFEVNEFLERLNRLSLGGVFRLPTEAEWEYAARAGTTTRFSFGEDPELTILPRHAWYYSRAEGRSHAVGLKKPNAWGLFDMHGNVWEWCNDWFAPFDESQAADDPAGPSTGTHRIIRGGSWFNEPEALRSANRHRHTPDSRQANLGFRVVWELP